MNEMKVYKDMHLVRLTFSGDPLSEISGKGITFTFGNK